MALFKRIAMLAAMLFALLSASAYDFEVDGIYYTVVSVQKLTCEVSKSPKDNEYSGEIKIPAEVSFRGKTLTVERIGRDAFKSCKSLTSVEIPNSVTVIGNRAFYECTSLASVKIPNSVTEIGEYAFCNCESITSIEIPNSVIEIGKRAFNGTSLTSIEIPNSVTEIGDGVFAGSSLTSIVIPNSVTKIGADAFCWCTSLTSVEIPNSVTEIGESAFFWCTSLTSIEIPNSVTKIEESTFSYCSSLASIDLPESLIRIGNYAFTGAPLTSITIPGKVKTIEFGAFYNCTKLDTINFEKGKEKLNLFGQFPEPDCFSDTGNNKTVIIQRNIIRDGVDHFSVDIDNIVSLTIGDSISVKGLFCTNYQKLQNLVLGKGVTLSNKINDSRYLTDNFYYRSGLQTLTVKDETPPFTIYCTHEQYMNIKVRVPAGSLQAYQSASGWKEFWDIEEYGESSGIESAAVTTEKTVSGKYDIYGRPVDDNYVGLVIIQYYDGTTEKVINR